jgi:hypothetical protein
MGEMVVGDEINVHGGSWWWMLMQTSCNATSVVVLVSADTLFLLLGVRRNGQTLGRCDHGNDKNN